MRLLFLLTFFLSTIWSYTQQCHRAVWVKTNGGVNSGEWVLDVEQHPDGGFVECGSYPTQGLVRGTESIAAGTGGFYLSHVDSSGTYSNLTSILPASYVTVKRIVVLNDGSVAVACNLLGNVTLGTETFHVHGGARALLVKFNSNFEYQWHVAAANTNNAQDTRDIAADSEGNIYWGGNFSGDFFVINETWINKNNGGAWLSKISTEGQLIWLNQLGSTASVGVQTVSVDSQDNVWISGQTTMPANGIFKFSAQVVANGFLNSSTSLYMAKYDTNGSCIWGKLSTTSSTFGSFYTWDAQAGANGTMLFCGKVTLAHNFGNKLINGDDGSGFLMRMLPDGSCQWVQTMGGQGSYEEASRIDYRNGKIAVFGYLSSNQPYIGSFPAYSLFNLSAKHFNANFYEDGSLEFARAYDSNSQDHYPVDVVLDEDGRQLLFGTFKGTQTWYPISLTQNGGILKNYIAKFDQAGNVPFSISAGPDKTTTCNVFVQLSGSTSATAVDYGWYPNLGFSYNSSKTPSVQPTAPGTYIFYGYLQGCVQSDTVQVAINNFDLTVDIPEEEIICVGETLQVVATSNNADATLVWSPNYKISSTTAADVNIYTNADMMYIVEATYNGCKAKDTLFVKAKPAPWMAVQNAYFYQSYQYSACMGDSIYIDLGDPANDYTITEGLNVSWINNHEIYMIADELSQYATVNATSPFGCTASAPVYLKGVNTPPQPVLVENPTDTIYLCPATGVVYEESFIITSDYVNPNNPTYYWSLGWQIDSLDGQGWRDLQYWDYGHYYMSPIIWGEFNYTYYSELELWNVHPEMDGFKFRSYAYSFCGERSYTQPMVLRVGPAIESQSNNITICEGASDSLFVNSTLNTSTYQWEVFRNNNWEIVVSGENNVTIDNNVLHITNATVGMDSLFRCRTAGCTPEVFMYSEPMQVIVQPSAIALSEPTTESICAGSNAYITFTSSPGNYVYQWYANGDAIDSLNTNYSGIHNDTLFVLNVDTTLAQFAYSCSIISEQCAQAIFTSEIFIDLLPSLEVEWNNDANIICTNAPAVTLAGGSPQGGEYNGSGVSNGLLYPEAAPLGEQIYTYTLMHPESGCVSTAEQNILIASPPTISFTISNDSLCMQSESIVLQDALPDGGTYSGEFITTDGANNYSFNTSNAFAGGHEIMYTYTDENGCTSNSIDSVYVLELPEISWVEYLGSVCIGDTNIIFQQAEPLGGTYYGMAIENGFIDTKQFVEGSYTISYVYTNEQGCTSSANSEIYFQGVDASFTMSDTIFCQYDNEIAISGGMPEGGIYTLDGVVADMLVPSLLNAGYHTLIYSYSEQNSLCTDTDAITVYIDSLPTVQWQNDFGLHCLSDSSLFVGNATPAGGIYSGGTFQNGYVFFESLQTGENTLNYYYATEFGCSTELTATLTINETPVIEWIPEPIVGFEVCVNLSENINLNAYIAPLGGTFTSNDINIENNIWTGLPSEESGQAIITYTYVDPLTNCTSVSQQSFEMIICFGIEETNNKPVILMQYGNELTINHNQLLTITLVNTLGQKVMMDSMRDTQQQWILNVANAPYFVIMSDGTSTWTEKIIVQK
jgi:hypothetical protein